MSDPIFPAHPDLTNEEQLTKLLDEILCLWSLGVGGFSKLDYYATELAFKAIIRARKNNPNFPVTASIHSFLKLDQADQFPMQIYGKWKSDE